MKKVTVLVKGLILYAAWFSDFQRGFLSEGPGNILEGKEVEDWIGERRSRLLLNFMRS